MYNKCQNLSLEQFQHLTKSKKDDSLLAVHVNMKISQKNFDSFKNILSLQDGGLDVVAVTISGEIKHLSSIEGYKLFLEADKAKNAGSVATYVKSNIQSSIRTDLQSQLSKSGELWVELMPGSDKAIVVGVIYKHSKVSTKNDFHKFSGLFLATMNKLKAEKKKVCVLGNLGINFLPETMSMDYKEELEKLGYFSVIDRPTMTDPTKSLATLTDHIYTSDNSTSFLKASGVVNTNQLSSHFPTFCLISSTPSTLIENIDKKKNSLALNFQVSLTFEQNAQDFDKLNSESFKTSVRFSNTLYEKMSCLFSNQFQILQNSLFEVGYTLLNVLKSISEAQTSSSSDDFESFLRNSKCDLVVSQIEELQKRLETEKLLCVGEDASLSLQLLDDLKKFLETLSLFLGSSEARFSELCKPCHLKVNKLLENTFIFSMQATTKLLLELANEVEDAL